jgi:hypothetical protein
LSRLFSTACIGKPACYLDGAAIGQFQTVALASQFTGNQPLARRPAFNEPRCRRVLGTHLICAT